MRLPDDAHRSRPWRIHELVPDFRLEDVWELPTPGYIDEFPTLVGDIAASDPAATRSTAARSLWSLRRKAGELLGLDDPGSGPGGQVPTLRNRLSDDLRAAPGPEFRALPFTSLYLTDNEFAAETANRTMHGVLHLGWVRERSGDYRAQMAVYVKPNGMLGKAYMAAIKPARHLVIYPQMMRAIERRWARRAQHLPAR
jgi:hypothetical protein